MRPAALLALTLLAACATTPDTAHTGVPRSTTTSYDVGGEVFDWTPTPPTTTTTVVVVPATTAPPVPMKVAEVVPLASEPVPAPPAPSGGRLGDPYYEPTWYTLRECEAPDWAGGWAANTGNGYYGGLQFAIGSWRAVGGTGYPHEHSPAEQIRRGQMLWEMQGWGAWPACSRKLGWR